MSNTKFPHKCQRCGHSWEGVLEHPASCPACKTYQWRKPRVPRVPQGEAALGGKRNV